jgi:hypothetical protein
MYACENIIKRVYPLQSPFRSDLENSLTLPFLEAKANILANVFVVFLVVFEEISTSNSFVLLAEEAIDALCLFGFFSAVLTALGEVPFQEHFERPNLDLRKVEPANI